MNKINDLRNEIDNYDLKILDILEKRIKLCEQIGKIKKENNISILCEGRENLILEKLYKNSILPNIFIEKIWTNIFNYSKNRQK
jgi:chorismate mutase